MVRNASQEIGDYRDCYYHYVEGATTIQFAELTKPEQEEQNLMKLDMIVTPDFIFKDYGVIGLSPDSDFVRYVFKTFGESRTVFEASIDLRKANGTSYLDLIQVKSDSLLIGSVLTLDGYKKSSIESSRVGWVYADSVDRGRWGIESASIYDDTNTNSFSGKICFRTDIPYLFLLSKEKEELFKIYLNNILCNKEAPCEVNSENTIESMPSLILNMTKNKGSAEDDGRNYYEHSIIIQPEQYMFENSGKWDYLISSRNFQGEISKYCSENDEIIVGAPLFL